jgi:hypothetical protein
MTKTSFDPLGTDQSASSEVTVLNPGDLFLKVKTSFSQKRYGCVIERLKMRTNEN